MNSTARSFSNAADRLLKRSHQSAAIRLWGFLLAVLMLAGCATAPQGAGFERLASVAEVAAYIGTVRHLRVHPEDRVKFELASQALASLASRDEYDPLKFADVIRTLPILDGPDASLYAEGAVLLWEQAVSSATPLDRAPLVKAVLARVQTGLQRGLNATP